jgi:large subunit ribosomal protein L1
LNKKFKEKEKLVEPGRAYLPKEAVELMPKLARAKFDETVDLALKLGVDVVKNPSVRGTINLPAGSGKSKKVGVITRADRVQEAVDAGAHVAGAEDLVEKIRNGFMDFDVLIATPDMMATVGKLGKILGTKGLMPNPKSGTVTPEISKAVKEFQGGKVEFKMDKGGAVHLGIGKVSFAGDALLKNLKAAVAAINAARPSGFKGTFIQSVTLSPTMGPGVKVDSRSILE